MVFSKGCLSKCFLNGLVVGLVVLLTGCLTTSQWPAFSGFLGDYKGIHRSDDVKGLFVATYSEKNVNDYSKFIVDPVTVKLIPSAMAYNMNKSELEVIAKNFRQNIIQALEENYTVVERPGADILRVRAAITDILKKKGRTSAVAIIEAEFVDTLTKERVAAVMTSAKGMLLENWATLLKDRLNALDSKNRVYQFE